MATYKFVDYWRIRAPLEEVFHYISDASTYPQWWPAYTCVEPVPSDLPMIVGRQSRLRVASVLGYHLNLVVEMAEYDPPRRFFTISRGDLDGTGEWVFSREGDVTVAKWTWVVETHHPLLNVLEPIAKPLFAWSHRNASEKGHRGLKKLLEK